jgi:hypothetical protein
MTGYGFDGSEQRHVFISPQGGSLKGNRRFEGIYRFYIQGRRISQARKQREADRKLYRFLASLILRP